MFQWHSLLSNCSLSTSSAVSLSLALLLVLTILPLYPLHVISVVLSLFSFDLCQLGSRLKRRILSRSEDLPGLLERGSAFMFQMNINSCE